MITTLCKIVSQRSVLALAAAFLLLFGTPSSSFAADAGAKPFLESIYKSYTDANADGIEWRGPNAQLYFDANLTKLILKDLKESKGELSRIEFDPFIYAQDFDLQDLSITVTPKGTARAVGNVSFKNIGAVTKITYDLVKTLKGWRIENMSWDGAEAGADNLRALLSRPLGATAEAD
ncbi:DUF3828 domain-containing protein [Microvirga terricola]|uniref:DUF3828 domain-containing protein n=1 Tax=Microvirga terricola TaxID=2719797 RepID=A0ABX0VE15_9HYPH|nr:DUF3828 domain-containing protein [Microvirga terricola]NIX78070.1 DUF3828 domain-containing protein [Microvirga terricola]